jgi:Uncharacterised protein family (UPF0259)
MNQPAKLKIIISDALQFFLNNLGQIAALCLPWLLAAALVEYGVILVGQNQDTSTPLFLVAWTFDLIVYPVYTGALIMLMARRAQRENPSNNELTGAAMKTWQPLFLVHIIVSGLKAMGFLLFIVPGIYLSVRLSFAEFHLVLEGLKPMEAIQKSFQTTKAYFGLILLLLAMFMIPLAFLAFAMVSTLDALKLDLIFNVLLGILLSFLTLIVDVVVFRVYMSAKQETPDAA